MLWRSSKWELIPTQGFFVSQNKGRYKTYVFQRRQQTVSECRGKLPQVQSSDIACPMFRWAVLGKYWRLKLLKTRHQSFFRSSSQSPPTECLCLPSTQQAWALRSKSTAPPRKVSQKIHFGITLRNKNKWIPTVIWVIPLIFSPRCSSWPSRVWWDHFHNEAGLAARPRECPPVPDRLQACRWGRQKRDSCKGWYHPGCPEKPPSSHRVRPVCQCPLHFWCRRSPDWHWNHFRR